MITIMTVHVFFYDYRKKKLQNYLRMNQVGPQAISLVNYKPWLIH